MSHHEAVQAFLSFGLCLGFVCGLASFRFAALLSFSNGKGGLLEHGSFPRSSVAGMGLLLQALPSFDM